MMDLIVSLTIAILYMAFFTQLVNILTGYNAMSEKCSGIMILNSTNKSSDCDDKLKVAEFQKHIILLMVSIVGMFVAVYIPNSSVQWGIGVGSLFTLLVAVFSYWRYYRENMKLLVTGISLIFSVLLAVKVLTKE